MGTEHLVKFRVKRDPLLKHGKLNKHRVEKDCTQHTLTQRVECSELFKGIKGAEHMVQYFYNVNGRDLYFDVRLHNSTEVNLKKRADTVHIMAQGGKIGLGNVVDFIAKNREKFLTVRKGVIAMIKAKRAKHLNEVRNPKVTLVKMGKD